MFLVLLLGMARECMAGGEGFKGVVKANTVFTTEDTEPTELREKEEKIQN